MYNFKKKIENIQNKILYKQKTYNELLNIFNINFLKENVNENRTILWLANKLYKDIINKFKNKQYKNIPNGKEIIIDDLSIIFDNTISYNDSMYNPNEKIIYVFTTANKNTIDNDFILKSNLIHELTHYLSQLDTTKYKNYNEINNKYYLQDQEIEANTEAISNFIIDLIKNNIKDYLDQDNVYNDNKIINKIDQILNTIITNKGFMYHNFILELSKDKEALNDFYDDIIKTCLDYIHNNLFECLLYIGGRVLNE